MAENNKDIIRNIPLNDIVKDLRVQEHVRKAAIELAKKTLLSLRITRFR